MTEIQQLKEDIAVLQEKLQKLEEIEKQPRMTLQQEGEYAVVSFNDKVYYRLMGETTFSWYIKKGVNVGYPVPTLMMVSDAETERLLEGLYYNHIQVKKEKEQRTKTSVKEAYKDWWGQYPELETDSQYDVTRWHGFQAGYNAAYEEKVSEEPKENEWKNVALKFGKKLPVILPYNYDELSPNAWYRWVVFTYDKYMEQRDIECGYTPKTPVKEAYKDWWGDYPELETDSQYDDTRWAGFQAGYEFAYAISTAKQVMEKVQKEQEVEPSMTNCVITGNPPDGYVTWQEWYNELGSKGILHNLRISSIDYKPTPQEPEVREWDVIRESVKWCEEHPDKDPLDWVKPQTPEQVADGLKQAFREAVKQGVVSSVEKPTDEEDNDKNFKNSLDLIKEWGEKNKPKTLYQIFIEWWDEDWGNAKEICIDKIIDKIDKEFIPPSSKRNTYEWEKCLKIMRDKLR